MDPVWAKVDAAGRLVIPKEMRAALGIPDGGELRLRVEDGELRGLGRMNALARIQREARADVPEDVSVVDEFLAERREAAAREAAEVERLAADDPRKPAA
jgi:AbrB family looped-hinge helix DNA binding protein